MALSCIGTAAGLDRVAAPGLWRLAADPGLAAAVTPLFAAGAAGAVVAALVQPMAHVARERPWPAALALALLVTTLLSPVSATVLLAVPPVAVLARRGRLVVIALVAAPMAPAIGMIALALAARRLGRRLGLPDAANDDHAAWPHHAAVSWMPAPVGSRRSARD